MRTQFDRYTQLINVYKSMGGGWVDEAAEMAPPPQLVEKGDSSGPQSEAESR